MDISELKKSFTDIYGNDREFSIFFCPGRVNLIGEHIDYNGGYVLPAALSIGIGAVISQRKDTIIRLNSLNAPGEVLIDLRENIVYNEKDDWGNYPKGVIEYLRKEGFVLAGYDILYSGNLPDGAGLSSSAAIEVLTAYMLMTMEGEKNIDRIAMAKLCQKVENEFVGVNCGIMDQVAVAIGIENDAILLDCVTLVYKHVSFKLDDCTLLIMNTNKRRELADSKYNERRAECDKALAILKGYNDYKDLCSAELVVAQHALKDDVLLRRTRHVITENQRVLKAVEVLNQGDLVTFGQLLNQSHASLKDDYEVTGKELDAIVAEAQKHEGCLGARMTGAGFGGCAIALVKNAAIADFKATVAANYEQATGLKPEFYISHIGDGVHQVF